jgi:hypothetical protein
MKAGCPEPDNEQEKASGQSLLKILILAAALIWITPAVQALDKVELNLGSIAAAQWKLENIRIALAGIEQNPQQLVLTIAKLSLPKPFDDLTLANIRCDAFSWRNKELFCEQGRANVRSKQWPSQAVSFSFHISEQRSSFKLAGLRFAGGMIAVDGEEQGDRWQLKGNAKGVDARPVQRLFAQKLFDVKAGKVTIQFDASGSRSVIDRFSLTAKLSDLSGQSEDGRFAAEKLILETTLTGKNLSNIGRFPADQAVNSGLWQWTSHADIKAGALYVDPVYLEPAGQNIVFDAEGVWNQSAKAVDISSVRYRHAKAGELSGRAIVHYQDGVKIEQAELSLTSHNLQDMSAVYLKPFFEQTALQGISFGGHVKADFSIREQAVTQLTAAFENFDLKDEGGRGEIQGGTGTFNWSTDELFNKPSEFAWQQLKVHALPIGPSSLAFLSRDGGIRLLKKTQLPFLGGSIGIDQFSWQAQHQTDPEVVFAGEISNVSLEQLSSLLGWTPLSGSIGGRIPRVEYSNNTLGLGGELVVKVFDGEVRISNLASSGLVTGYPKFHSDLEIDNLDLDQLTGKFKFGGITGKLSGYVQQLYMENWQPVSFFAWLGTPENDDSRHRISQKAVQNIASIGGGGTVDLLSRSFLRFFETFGYDKLGLGCYLHDGVCQLMGVEARESGYAIITGGGLPRIDVIGYNPRVDWNVLIDRLKRISTSEASVSY